MSDDILIKVDHVSKKFCKDLKRSLWYGLKDVSLSMKGNVEHHNRLRKDEFWAVHDVSFELRRGEFLGMISVYRNFGDE
jgi:lipopolysaccharide transport system ATP-binding protein